MSTGTLLSRATGLVRVSVTLAALGLTAVSDTYNAANTTPNIVYELVLGGILTSVFVPLIVERVRGHDDWRETTSRFLTIAVVLLGGLALLGMVVAPWIMRLYLAGVADETQRAEQVALGTTLLRWFMPQVVFYGVAAIAGGVLTAHRRFAAQMFAPVLNNLTVIATMAALIALGVEGRSPSQLTTGQITLMGLGTTARHRRDDRRPVAVDAPDRLPVPAAVGLAVTGPSARSRAWPGGSCSTSRSNQLAFLVAHPISTGGSVRVRSPRIRRPSCSSRSPTRSSPCPSSRRCCPGWRSDGTTAGATGSSSSTRAGSATPPSRCSPRRRGSSCSRARSSRSWPSYGAVGVARRTLLADTLAAFAVGLPVLLGVPAPDTHVLRDQRQPHAGPREHRRGGRRHRRRRSRSRSPWTSGSRAWRSDTPRPTRPGPSWRSSCAPADAVWAALDGPRVRCERPARRRSGDRVAAAAAWLTARGDRGARFRWTRPSGRLIQVVGGVSGRGAGVRRRVVHAAGRGGR